jgi:transcriptional regulator with XRE-family HTH domain
MGFRDRFQALVKERGTTQEAIASLVGINRVTISKWMAKGIIPRADQAEKIARHLGVTVEYLLDIDDSLDLKQPSSIQQKEYVTVNSWIASNRDVILDLMALDSSALELVRPMIAAAASEARRRK